MIIGRTDSTVVDIVDAPQGTAPCKCVELRRATAQKLINFSRPFYFRVSSSYCDKCHQFPFLTEGVMRAYGIVNVLNTTEKILPALVRVVCDELWPKERAGEIAQRFEISERSLSNWMNGKTPIIGKARAAFKGAVSNYMREQHAKTAVIELIYLDQLST